MTTRVSLMTAGVLVASQITRRNVVSQGWRQITYYYLESLKQNDDLGKEQMGHPDILSD